MPEGNCFMIGPRHLLGARYLPALAALAAGAALTLAAPAPSHAQDFIRSFMADIGLAPRTQQPINYRERAPLVIPKSLDTLPPPEPGTAATAGAAWPTDPDKARLSAAEAERNLPETERWRYIANHEGQYPVSPAELRRNRAAAEAVVNGPNSHTYSNASFDPNRLTPDQLRKGVKKPVSTAFVREPPRQRLTDPPTGYRTPAADAPYAAGKDIVHRHVETYREAADRVLEEAPPPQ
jgi:hypothetical protein